MRNQERNSVDRDEKELPIKAHTEPKDYTKQGVLNWICIQDDDKDISEVIKMCFKKMDAMNYLRESNKFGSVSSPTKTRGLPPKEFFVPFIERIDKMIEDVGLYGRDLIEDVKSDFLFCLKELEKKAIPYSYLRDYFNLKYVKDAPKEEIRKADKFVKLSGVKKIVG